MTDRPLPDELKKALAALSQSHGRHPTHGPLAMPTPESMTPTEELRAAVCACDLAAVRAALAKGADPNGSFETEEDGARVTVPIVYCVASHGAAHHDIYTASAQLRNREVSIGEQVAVLECLLSSGADPDSTAMGACTCGSSWISALVASFPSLALAETLLRHGANPHNGKGWREEMNNDTAPLELVQGHPELKQLLIQYIANWERRGT